MINLFEQNHFIPVMFSRLYKQEQIDGSTNGVKWSCPNIHDLMHILECIKIDKILDRVFDKRLSKLDKLCVTQLREECEMLNLEKKGKKVTFTFTFQIMTNSYRA